VNVPSLGQKELSLLQPYLGLAESMGRFQAQLVDKAVSEVKIEFAGEIVDVDAAPVTRAFLSGLLRDVSARVNVVNAFLIADERGIKVTTTYVRTSGDSTPAIRSEIVADQSSHTVAGTLVGYGNRREGRITEIDGFHLEATPHGHMLVMRNRDVPGVIGRVGTILGEGEVNISHFHLGRRERGGEAMAVIEIDAPIIRETLEALRSLDQVIEARAIELS
jgi:D-3-phosphoglycerate dehydrogenase